MAPDNSLSRPPLRGGGLTLALGHGASYAAISSNSIGGRLLLLPYLEDTSMCEHLDSWAKTVPAGQSSTVKLIRGGTWMVNHYKSCEHSDSDSAAGVFCEWLMENTSTEFMESNINRSMTCLQGQRIAGLSGNTGIESWSGKASFYRPQLATADVRVDLEYSLDNSKESREDFLQFTVRAR